MKSAVQLQSLEVVVLASQVPDEQSPIIGEPHFYHDITRGRPGGSRQI